MLKIINGEVYDPLNSLMGVRKDLFVKDGKIVSEGGGSVIDAKDMVIMPGGVDIHSHIAGSKVNSARKLRPEDHRDDVVSGTDVTRSGVGGIVPTSFVTGYRYSQMGYTTVIEAATPPLTARHAHEELNDIPMLDKGIMTMMGNNYIVMDLIRRKEYRAMRDYVAWLLSATKGYAVKLVNPGGVENWKSGKNVDCIDDKVIDLDITPRQIITWLARANEELGLPHPIHMHCNSLGIPGNYRCTLKTLSSLEGMRVHLCHLQFHSYGGKTMKGFSSRALELAEYINKHDNITVDVGQVVFGDVTTMTGDGPWQHRLWNLTKNKWVNSDMEMEGGAGIVPFRYKKSTLVNAIQWAIGLELMLLIEDPWRVYLTTDHPNGGPFTAYPQIIKLLMDKDYRNSILESLPPKAIDRTHLKEIAREYTLNEIAIITRAGTARRLGLKNKGHLGAGADADIAIYRKSEDREEMFTRPAYVIKGGTVVARDGSIVQETFGKTYYVKPSYDKKIEKEIKKIFEKFYSIKFANYFIESDYLRRPCIIKP
jgi:formylmethanofuran dehydrogenase subunit A